MLNLYLIRFIWDPLWPYHVCVKSFAYFVSFPQTLPSLFHAPTCWLWLPKWELTWGSLFFPWHFWPELASVSRSSDLSQTPWGNLLRLSIEVCVDFFRSTLSFWLRANQTYLNPEFGLWRYSVKTILNQVASLMIRSSNEPCNTSNWMLWPASFSVWASRTLRHITGLVQPLFLVRWMLLTRIPFHLDFLNSHRRMIMKSESLFLTWS